MQRVNRFDFIDTGQCKHNKYLVQKSVYYQLFTKTNLTVACKPAQWPVK